MREILFRGKTTDTGEWIHGIAFPHDDGSCTMFYQHPMDGALEGREVDPDTVGQYTGLRDKNGARIYEGDIVKATLYPECSVYGYVEWSQKDCCFRVRLSKNNSTGVHESDIVVGDIHCDPEFVKRMMTE